MAAPYPWLGPGVFAGSVTPLFLMLWRAGSGELGADAVAISLNQLGLLALTFLTASLSCTPLKLARGWTWPLRLRRMLGLFAFLYAFLHFAVYLALDQGFDLGAVLEDISKRTFILAGFSAFVLLVPLALTSTQKSLRLLGFARWQRLHRLAYLAGILGALHYILRVKADLRQPAIFAFIIAAGLVRRLVSRSRGTR